MDDFVKVKGRLTKIFFERENYFIGRISSGKENWGVKGVCDTGAPCINDYLIVRGPVEESKYGNTIVIREIAPYIPDDSKGVKEILQSLHKVGPVRAGQIVERFGKDAINVLIENPNRIKEISGLKGKVGDEIASSVVEKYYEIKSMQLLAELHLGKTACRRAITHYGTARLKTILKENPYELISIEGINFESIDAYMLKKGIKQDDPRRTCAVIIDVIKHHCVWGDTYITQTLLNKRYVSFRKSAKPIYPYTFDQALSYAITNQIIEEVEKNGKICGYGLKKTLAAEKYLAEKIEKLLNEKDAFVCGNMDYIEEDVLSSLTEEQKKAVENAIENNISILTGGPGTGKTYTINAILMALGASSIVYCMAPTGKAAKRATEITGCDFKTIHSSIATFSQDKHTSSEMILVIDETSMVSCELMRELLYSIGDVQRIKIILSGDVDQLPSIQPGDLLRDLIDCKKIPCVHLTQIQRQKAKSKIIAYSHSINKRVHLDVSKMSYEDDCYLINEPDAEKIPSIIYSLIEEHRDKHNVYHDIQVLSGQKKAPHIGTFALNEYLRNKLNSKKGQKELQRTLFTSTLRVGDKVIFTQNNRDLGVANGDTGIISDIHLKIPNDPVNNRNKVIVTLDTKDVVVVDDQETIASLDQAWAMTVHKSQGSEYPLVIFVVHENMRWALQPNLVYTGITRGKEKVVLVGTPRALRTTCNTIISPRKTTLGYFLQNDSEDDKIEAEEFIQEEFDY